MSWFSREKAEDTQPGNEITTKSDKKFTRESGKQTTFGKRTIPVRDSKGRIGGLSPDEQVMERHNGK